MRIEAAACFRNWPTRCPAAAVRVDDATRVPPKAGEEAPELAEGASSFVSVGLAPDGGGAQSYGEEEDESEAKREDAAHGIPFRKAAPVRATVPERSGLTRDMVPRDD
jgi:hypothetical protein